MEARGYSVVGKIMFLMKRINIRPVYMIGPLSLAVIAAALEGAGLALLIPILDGFLKKSFTFLFTIPVLGSGIKLLPESILSNDRLLFLVILCIFLCVFITRNVFRYLSIISVSYYSERALHHLRKSIFDRYLSFGKLYFDTSNVGHHSTLLMEFTRLAFRPLIFMHKYVNALFSLVVYITVMFLISWKLTLIALPLFGILHIAIKGMIMKIRAISHRITEKGNELGKTAVEILSTIPLVKSYSMEVKERQHYTGISDKKAVLDFKARALQEVVLPLQEVLTLIFAVIIFAGSLYFLGRDQVASEPAFIVYFYIVVNASSKFGVLSGFRGALAIAAGPLDEVLEVFDDANKHHVQGGKKQFTGINNGIEFRNMSFAYAVDVPILKNVSFTMKAGQMTAIVGPTGSGKSTVINLIMRYYDCSPGQLFIDGVDIREFELSSLLHHIALVSQDTLLFHDSLRNNITYGLNDVSEQILQEAIDSARLREVVNKLPNGLDTLIGDRGVKLSGGEKQRLSIARALVKGSEILILDEATSSLDSQTESVIQEAIDEAVQGRTVIVIAHRLSTIQHADTIVVIDNGHVVEQGNLDDLLTKKGKFFDLWEEQQF